MTESPNQKQRTVFCSKTLWIKTTKTKSKWQLLERMPQSVSSTSTLPLGDETYLSTSTLYFHIFRELILWKIFLFMRFQLELSGCDLGVKLISFRLDFILFSLQHITFIFNVLGFLHDVVSQIVELVLGSLQVVSCIFKWLLFII